MKRYLIPFGTYFITIQSKKPIKHEVMRGVRKLISLTQDELNHKYNTSSAYFFNEAPSGVEIKVAPEFILFLKINQKYFAHDKEGFSPFLFTGEKPDDSDIFIYDRNHVIKTVPLMLDSSKLRTAHILDLIQEFLTYNKVSNYLISYNQHYIARGAKAELSIHVDDVKPILVTLKNSATSLHFNTHALKHSAYAKEGFASTYKSIVHNYSITTNATLVENKVLGSYLEKIDSKHGYEHFSSSWKKFVRIVDTLNQVHTFSPST